MPAPLEEKKLIAQMFCSIVESLSESIVVSVILEKPPGNIPNIENVYNRLAKLVTES